MSSATRRQPRNPETASALMYKRVPSVDAKARIEDARHCLQDKSGEIDTFNYVYVLDNGKLVGVLSLKSIFSEDPHIFVSEVMHSAPLSVTPGTDQEAVARLALRHQLKAVPVTNDNGKLLGAVPSHAILKVLEQEHEEDALQAAGLDTAVLQQHRQSVTAQARSRLPWLLLGMAGGIGAAWLIAVYEAALAEEALLAAFIPAVVYLADAAGVQVQTVYIRLQARARRIRTVAYMVKEIFTSTLIAIVLGLSMLGIITVWFQSLQVALIVGISVFVTVVLAGFLAVLLPWIFMRIGRDPAVASGPLSTIIVDVLSILIYFSIAHQLLSKLV